MIRVDYGICDLWKGVDLMMKIGWKHSKALWRLLLVVGFAITSLNANITGTVFRDIPLDGTILNAYGVKNNNESGVPGVTVTAYDSSGSLVGTTTTASNGTYTLVVGAGQYRIEFSDWLEYLEESTDAGGNNTSVQFVSDGSIASLALHNPGDYTPSINPKTAVTMLMLGRHDEANTSIPKRTINIFDYNKTAIEYNASNQVELNSKITTGAIYGMAYDRMHKKLYTSAFLKRHSGLGVGGLGAIYVTDLSSINASAPTAHFVTIPNVIAGALPARGGPADSLLKHDDAVFGLVGHVGLGDIDISEDDKILYVMNLNDKKVYTVTDLQSSQSVQEFATIPDPVCQGGGFRPFALKVHDGKLYAGGICDASISKNRNDHKAYVYVFDLENDTVFNTTPVLSFDLIYTRERTVNILDNGALGEAVRDHSKKWYWWSDDYNGTLFNELNKSDYWYIVHGQPQLRDIEFDDNGNMVIGLQSRTADQLGSLTYRTGDPDGANEVKSIQSGDILRAAKNPAGDWSIEPHVTSGGAISEFYVADRYHGPAHLETAFGALAHLAGSKETMMTLMDPCHDAVSGGARRISDVNGSHVAGRYGIEIYGKYAPGTFGKSGGLGDIELLAAPAPIEIGNRVWFDADANGVQDAGEAGMSGVTVELYDASGATLLATAATDSNGNYIFSNDASGATTASHIYDIAGLYPDTDYIVRIPNTSGGSKQAALGSSLLTGSNQGTDIHDSNGIANGVHANATVHATDIPSSGANNHSFDFGFSLPATLYRIGTHFWIDENNNAAYDLGTDMPIGGALVELLDENGAKLYWADATHLTLGVIPTQWPAETRTTTAGEYGFDVPAGKYNVRFNIPQNLRDGGYVFSSRQTRAGDQLNRAGSNGVAVLVEVGPGIAVQDLTLDACVHCPCSSILSDGGDALRGFAWILIVLMMFFAGLFFIRRELE